MKELEFATIRYARNILHKYYLTIGDLEGYCRTSCTYDTTVLDLYKEKYDKILKVIPKALPVTEDSYTFEKEQNIVEASRAQFLKVIKKDVAQYALDNGYTDVPKMVNDLASTITDGVLKSKYKDMLPDLSELESPLIKAWLAIQITNNSPYIYVPVQNDHGRLVYGHFKNTASNGIFDDQTFKDVINPHITCNAHSNKPRISTNIRTMRYNPYLVRRWLPNQFLEEFMNIENNKVLGFNEKLFESYKELGFEWRHCKSYDKDKYYVKSMEIKDHTKPIYSKLCIIGEFIGAIRDNSNLRVIKKIDYKAYSKILDYIHACVLDNHQADTTVLEKLLPDVDLFKFIALDKTPAMKESIKSAYEVLEYLAIDKFVGSSRDEKVIKEVRDFIQSVTSDTELLQRQPSVALINENDMLSFFDLLYMKYGNGWVQVCYPDVSPEAKARSISRQYERRARTNYLPQYVRELRSRKSKRAWSRYLSAITNIIQNPNYVTDTIADINEIINNALLNNVKYAVDEVKAASDEYPYLKELLERKQNVFKWRIFNGFTYYGSDAYYRIHRDMVFTKRRIKAQTPNWYHIFNKKEDLKVAEYYTELDNLNTFEDFFRRGAVYTVIHYRVSYKHESLDTVCREVTKAFSKGMSVVEIEHEFLNNVEDCTAYYNYMQEAHFNTLIKR